MKQAISFITLGVKNLPQAKDFYKNIFGWQPMKDEENITFFKMNGFVLGLFAAHDLAEDIGITNDGSGFRQFTLAINFASQQEVDDAFANLEAKGVRIIKPPQKVFWGGYSGYIADFENNYWELCYNPVLKIDESNNVLLQE